MRNEKLEKSFHRRQKFLKFGEFLYIIITVICAFATFAAPFFIFFFLLSLILSVYLHRAVKKQAALKLLSEKYLPIVADRREWDLDNVSAYLRLPFDTVKEDLLQLMSNGNIVGVYYNPAEHRLVSYTEHGQSAWQ